MEAKWLIAIENGNLIQSILIDVLISKQIFGSEARNKF